MPTLCIHGFPTEQCASCRNCPHGLALNRCARCRAATTSRRASAAEPAAHEAEEYSGYEIYYEPGLTGWRYRGADASPSPLSYRSRFLARRAVDEAIAGLSAAPPPKRAGRNAKTAGEQAKA